MNSHNGLAANLEKDLTTLEISYVPVRNEKRERARSVLFMKFFVRSRPLPSLAICRDARDFSRVQLLFALKDERITEEKDRAEEREGVAR